MTRIGSTTTKTAPTSTTAPSTTAAPAKGADATNATPARNDSNFPPVGDSGYEVSDPRQRLSVDRASTQVPQGDASLQNEVMAHRAGAAVTGRARIGDGSEGIVGMGRNNAATALRSRTGRVAANDWNNPEQIVGHLTQTPGRGRQANSSFRCAPANLFGAAMMNSPDHAARLLENTAANSRAGQLTATDQREMNDIAGRIRNRSATYEDLSRAQGLMYNAGNTETNAYVAAGQTYDSPRIGRQDRTRLDALLTKMERPGTTLNATDRRDMERIMSQDRGTPVTLSLINDPQNPTQQIWGVQLQGQIAARDRSGFNDAEVANLAQVGGATTSRAAQLDVAQHHPMEHLLGRLEPGQSATLRVHHDADVDDASASPDHYITIGKRPDGTAYVYNSDPARQDHTLYTGPTGGGMSDGLQGELRRYDNRIAFEDDGDVPQVVTTTFAAAND